MDNPLVSIITPSYNQAKYLEQTILSVLNQSYQNIEYIIIDGGSTDGSVDIIKKYESQLAYWHSKPDAGQANAINIGFAKSKGQIIAYINSDDYYEPNAVQTVVRTYEINDEFAIFYGNCNTVDTDGNIIKESEGSQVSYEYLLKVGMLPKIFQPACFFNRAYLGRKYFVDEKLKYAFDYELLLHLIKEKSSLFLYSTFANYRIHNKSKSYTNAFEAYKEKIQVQENTSVRHMYLWKWRRVKLFISVILGKWMLNVK